MYKGIKPRTILVFVLVTIIAQSLAGLAISLYMTISYHKDFKKATELSLTDTFRQELINTANEVVQYTDPLNPETIIITEPGEENVYKLRDMMLATDLFRTYQGMDMAILNGSGKCMYQNYDTDTYKDARVTEEALKGNEAINNNLTGKDIEYALPLSNGTQVQFVIYFRDPMTLHNQMKNKILFGFAISIGISAVVMFLIALMFSKTLTLPLKRLAAQAKKLADGDDFASVASNYNEADTIETTIKRGDYPYEVDLEAFNLDNGQQSGMIATSNGYYFIKCLNKFERELKDVTLEKVVIPVFDEFDYILDVVFDNIFTDWSIKNKISQSLQQVNNTVSCIEKVLDDLYKDRQDNVLKININMKEYLIVGQQMH